MNNIIFESDDKSRAEKQLMEELERGEHSGDEEGYLNIDECKARLGI